MIDALRRFVASVYSWKLTLLLERSYYMSLQFQALTEAVDKLTAQVVTQNGVVAAAQADRDHAVQALADEQASAATQQASDQAVIDSLTAKVSALAP